MPYRLFTDSDELIDLAVGGIRLTVLMFPFVGAQIVIGNFFSIGKAKVSIFLSLTRQLLYLCLAYYCSLTGGIGRYLDQYAGIGCAGVYYGRYQSDDLYQEGFQTASGSSRIRRCLPYSAIYSIRLILL